MKGTELFSMEEPDMWAEVILPLALPQVYTYHVPKNLQASAIAGIRAEVIFGKARRYAGIVKSVHYNPPAFPTKPVIQFLDDQPLVFDHQLELWNWMAQYYMCTEGEVMAAALPVNFKLSSETILLYNEEAGDDFSNLSDNEFLVAEALLIRKQLTIDEVQSILDASHVYPVVKKLVEKAVCIPWEKMTERYIPKKEKFVTLNAKFNNEDSLEALLNDWSGAAKQMEMLLAFLHFSKTQGEVKQADLLKKSGGTTTQLNALVSRGILFVESRRVDRIPVSHGEMNVEFSLTSQQESALDNLKRGLNGKEVVLLHGVTGSGKTQLYVKLIAEYVKRGEQVLYLLPEIALTAQLIRRLQEYFGGHISIYHSRFNDQERVELWNKVRSGETRIILGARSSLFLPFQQLGLVIVDEEHDQSYKQQDPAPRYNARDAAIYYAHLKGARVILGSATPSIESYFNVLQGKYGMVHLPERFGGIELPKIELVNTHGMLGTQGKVMISEQLRAAVEATVEDGRQVILFQNRRGYDPYLICGSCGYIPQCSECDVSLTMHKFSKKLHCHYCGKTYPVLIACPACGVQRWLEKNFGTEKIEEHLEAIFSDYRIARMDVDSVKGKHAHDNLIRRFEQKQIDILIGTQMVVKGLDFEHVDLVGIIDADGLLGFTDFRVNERAFQLMEQVSGRAGRKHRQGKVIIQAMHVQHPVLQFVVTHNYEGFYKMEIAKRNEFHYPPFFRLIRITCKHKDKQVVSACAAALAVEITKVMKDINGPAAPVIGRIRNLYLMEIMIKLPRDGSHFNYKRSIESNIQLIKSSKAFASVKIICDVDPY